MPDEQQGQPEEQNGPELQEQTRGGGAALVSPLDPDFLLFALPFALLIDILDWALELGTIVSLVLGAPLIVWMMSKGGKGPSKKDIQQRHLQAAKAARKKALKRGVLVFIVELIPFVNLLPFWLITVLAMLRQKSELIEPEGSSEPERPASPAIAPQSEGAAVSPA